MIWAHQMLLPAICSSLQTPKHRRGASSLASLLWLASTLDVVSSELLSESLACTILCKQRQDNQLLQTQPVSVCVSGLENSSID